MKKIYLFLLCFITTPAFAARVYQTNVMGEATVKVAIVQNREEADLLVYRVGSFGLARGDAVVFVTRNRQEATSVWYMTSRGMADITVMFVNSMSEAGWQKPSRYRGRL